MALFNCGECNKEISDKADKCPHCGCPVEKTPVQISPEEVTPAEAVHAETAQGEVATPSKKPIISPKNIPLVVISSVFIILGLMVSAAVGNIAPLIFLIGLLFGVMSLIGVVSPKTVLGKWGEKFTRIQTFILFIVLFLAFVIGGSMLQSRRFEAERKKDEAEKIIAKEKADADAASALAVKKKKEEAEKKRLETLKARLETDRPKIVEEIKTLINNQKYKEAIAKTDEFKDFNVDEFKTLAADARSKQAKEEEKKLLALLKTVQPSDYNKNIELYGNLFKLFPNNSVYKEKLDGFNAQKAEKDKKERERIARERAMLASFGPEPIRSSWDGSYSEVERYLKRVANDPDSIKIDTCTGLYHTQKGWLVGCDYRGKNAFGALIKKSNWFTIVNNQVVNVEEISAYNMK